MYKVMHSPTNSPETVVPVTTSVIDAPTTTADLLTAGSLSFLDSETTSNNGSGISNLNSVRPVSSSMASVVTKSNAAMTSGVQPSSAEMYGGSTFSTHLNNPMVSSYPYAPPYFMYPPYAPPGGGQIVYRAPYSQFQHGSYDSGEYARHMFDANLNFEQVRKEPNNAPQFSQVPNPIPNPLYVKTESLVDIDPPVGKEMHSVPRSFHRDFKLPSFWKDQPKAWFEFVEGKLSLMNIESDSLKYYAIADVLSSDPNIRRDIRDLLDKPPSANKYDALRERLEDVYSETSRQKIETLLSSVELGDRRPSQLLRELQFRAGNMCDTHFLKQIWNRRLPQFIRTSLASIPDDYPLEK